LKVRTGIIGLGRMGQAMAARLLEAGQPLIVFNRNPARAKPLLEAGATLAGSIRDLCRDADLVLTMLANDAALEEVCNGSEGVLANLKHGSVHIAMGTHSVGLIGKLAQAHDDNGQKFVCAPVLGRPEAARTGQVTIVAAGDADGIEQAGDVFGKLARNVVNAGVVPKTAASMKLANNYMLGSAIQSMAEAFVIVHKAGGDVSQFREIITGGLFSGVAHATYSGLIEAGTFDQVGFAIELALKDIELILEAGRELEVPLPTASLVRNRLISMVAQGEGGLDWAALVREQGRASGLAVDGGSSIWGDDQ
jgi:3-hydroxyisobutyrate dehydrogenase-like beta-hydroxyacid dehydrogenase